MRVLILLFSLLISATSFAQISFYKLYSGSGYDKGEGIVQMADSSYVLTGSSSSWGQSQQAFLLAVDSLGNYKWSQSYGGPETDQGKRVLHISGDGFVVAGISNSFGAGDYDAFLFKTDEQGNQLWTKNIPFPNAWEKINDAVLTADSGVVMVGELLPLTNSNADMYIVRTNKMGDTLWTKRWGSDGEDKLNAVLNRNGNFILAGQVYVQDSSMIKGFLCEIDGNGNVLWADTISDKPGEYVINDISLGTDKIFLTGYSKLSTRNDVYFGVYDFTGQLFSQYTIVASDRTQRGNQLIYNAIKNKVAVAYQTINASTFQDDYDLIHAYFDVPNLYWLGQFNSINKLGADDVGEIVATSDGGFISVGYAVSSDQAQLTSDGGSHIYLNKVDQNDVFPSTTSSFALNHLVEIKENEVFEGVIYPNPTQEVLHVHFSKSGTHSYELCSIDGTFIQAGKLQQMDSIDVSELPEGMYLLRIGNAVTRFVKN